MLSNTNSTVANTIAQSQTSHFTFNVGQAKPGFKTNTVQASKPSVANVANTRQKSYAPQMSIGAFNNGAIGSNPNMAKMGFSQAINQSSTFLGEGPSSMPVSNQIDSASTTVPIKMSMFGSSNPGARTNQTSQVMNNFGHQVNMTKMQMGANKARTSSVVMMAEAVVKGETAGEVKEDHMDRIFLQQKYDNADHLDPVLHYEGNKYIKELMENAKKLAAPGKGILASDESNGTCGKRFEAIGVENTEQNRNDYRELLYTVDGLEEFVSGAIMYDETIRQNDSKGTPLTKVLGDKGILTGIKVDTGISIIEGTNDETVTNGLDGLSERCAEYYKMGARFAKWRAVLKITDDGCPSEVAITETAHSLARYATICQHAGLVPIVEPEILTDGTHDIKKCARVSERVFNAVMNELITQRILLEGMLLKPNMITSGAQAEVQAGPEEVAYFTVRTLGRTIPPAVPGITFLSGGQSEEVACQNLNAINKLAEVKHPWSMTYSFGRALQSSVLTTWMGKKENVKAAQDRLYERCQACSSAAKGKYEGGAGSTQSDYVANYVY